MQNKGFTLIELLVVIAIIGILAGIIVVSMGAAQKQATDAKIQATMSQMRTAAQMYYTSNSSYGANGVSTTSDCTIASGMSAANTNYYNLCNSLSTKPVTTIGTTASAGTKFCAYATLTAPTSTTYYCVDSGGYSGNISSTTNCTTATAVTCQ
ncbi:MAG: prepilin-type N-terminal cleavage/methylation domain-containing protein [Candidatus Paceibacterota bacterium]